MRQKKSSIKMLVFIGIIILIIFLNKQFGWSAYLSNIDHLVAMKIYIDENMLVAFLVYVIITIIGCVVLALPGVTFALFAGILFGPWIGTLACLIATTIGASLAFVVGRFFLKDSVKPMLEGNKVLKKLLFEEEGKNSLIVLMITRMVPIFPYNLQNFAYGITDIGFWKYTVYTFFFMMPGVAFFTIGASGLIAGENKWNYFIIAGILALLVTIAGYIIKNKFLDKE
ncbi:MAG: VTT domain-containing protein [Lachnospiraceae bacterium]